MEQTNGISRRSLLAGASVAAAGLPTAGAQTVSIAPTNREQKLKVAIFSKHLLFLRGAALAEGAASIGFDGIDLAVRKGGHVEPERVKQDLPGLVATIRQHGLEVPMLTTDIIDDKSPNAEDIVSTMAELGIRHYRWGGFKYDDQQPLNKQIEMLKPRVAKLAALNGRYRVGAMFHTHSGVDLVGASIWDLHEILEGMDPALVGVNYDVGHATVEGGFGGWINSYRISGAYLRGIAVKDFVWEKDTHGKWRPAWKPLGDGMVRFPEFFKMVAASQFSGPLQLHFEYPLAGADTGRNDIGGHKDEVFAAMRRDLGRLREYLKQAQLA
jgi:sugar phosphate isomerase/epimerase